MPPVFAPDRADFYLADPHPAFRRLRAEDPLHFYQPGPFWCVTRHSDVLEISRTPRTFSSAHGTNLFQIRDQIAGRVHELQTAPSIIQMDPPQHNRHRKLAIQASPRAWWRGSSHAYASSRARAWRRSGPVSPSISSSGSRSRCRCS
jgi:hypothetical protein